MQCPFTTFPDCGTGALFSRHFNETESVSPSFPHWRRAPYFTAKAGMHHSFPPLVACVSKTRVNHNQKTAGKGFTTSAAFIHQIPTRWLANCYPQQPFQLNMVSSSVVKSLNMLLMSSRSVSLGLVLLNKQRQTSVGTVPRLERMTMKLRQGGPFSAKTGIRRGHVSIKLPFI